MDEWVDHGTNDVGGERMQAPTWAMVPGCTVDTVRETAGPREAPPGLHRESGHHSSHDAAELHHDHEAGPANQLLGDTLDSTGDSKRIQTFKV